MRFIHSQERSIFAQHRPRTPTGDLQLFERKNATVPHQHGSVLVDEGRLEVLNRCGDRQERR